MNLAVKFTSAMPEIHNDENLKDQFYACVEFGTYVEERMKEWFAVSKTEIIHY